MTQMMHSDRRTFLRRTAVGAGALWVSALHDFAVKKAHGETAVAGSPYGDVSPVLDQTTGLPLLQLPKGFRYLSYGMTGDPMSDGVATPSLHDGMAVVADVGHGRGLFGSSHLKDSHHRRHLWWWYNNINDNDHDFDGGRGLQGSVLRSRRPPDSRPQSRARARNAVRGQSEDPVQVRRRRRHHERHLQRAPRTVRAFVVHAGRHGSQLRRRRDAVGHVGHQRGDRRAGTRLELRGRPVQGRSDAASRPWAASRTKR